MVGNRIAGATGGFVSAGLTWSNNDHFCHIANNWLHVANLNGALRISSLRSGAGENVVVNNSIETSISDNTEGINVTGTVTAGTILKIENNALHDLGHVYLFWRTVAPDGIRFGVCGFAVQGRTVPQRAAAPSSAGCVAARSQVATYSLPASDLQKNWLAARYTTINKHALARCRMEEPPSRITPELLEKVKAGDETANRALVEILYPTVRANIRNHLRRQADHDDVAQEVFMKIFLKIAQ